MFRKYANKPRITKSYATNYHSCSSHLCMFQIGQSFLCNIEICELYLLSWNLLVATLWGPQLSFSYSTAIMKILQHIFKLILHINQESS